MPLKSKIYPVIIAPGCSPPDDRSVPRNGVYRGVYELTRSLSLLGLSPTVFVDSRNESRFPKSMRIIPIRPAPQPPINSGFGYVHALNLELIKRCWEFVKRKGSILHLHDFRQAGVGILLKTISPKCPLVVTCHGTVTGRFAAGKSMKQEALNEQPALHYCAELESALARAADAVIVHTGEMKKEAVEILRVQPDRVHVAPSGIDVGLYRYQGDAGRNPFLIAYVGRLSQEKGVDFLLKGWHTFMRRCPKAQLEIIGDGPKAAELIHWAKKHLKEGSYRFRGAQPYTEVRNLFLKAVLAVVPSLYEAGAVAVVLEAMSCGCPVLVTDTGGMGEMVDNGNRGILVRPASVGSLTGGIQYALSHRREIRHLAVAARRWVEKSMDWKIAAQNILSIYENCVNVSTKQARN